MVKNEFKKWNFSKILNFLMYLLVASFKPRKGQSCGSIWLVVVVPKPQKEKKKKAQKIETMRLSSQLGFWFYSGVVVETQK